MEAACGSTNTATAAGCPGAEPHSYFGRPRQPEPVAVAVAAAEHFSVMAFLQRTRPVAPRTPFRWAFPPPVVNPAAALVETAPLYRNGGFGAVPASRRAISDLPEITAGEAREKACSVCMEAFREGETLRRMPCAHAFHQGCISHWLRVSRLCPLCRFALPTREQDDQHTMRYL